MGLRGASPPGMGCRGPDRIVPGRGPAGRAGPNSERHVPWRRRRRWPWHGRRGCGCRRCRSRLRRCWLNRNRRARRRLARHRLQLRFHHLRRPLTLDLCGAAGGPGAAGRGVPGMAGRAGARPGVCTFVGGRAGSGGIDGRTGGRGSGCAALWTGGAAGTAGACGGTCVSGCGGMGIEGTAGAGCRSPAGMASGGRIGCGRGAGWSAAISGSGRTGASCTIASAGGFCAACSASVGAVKRWPSSSVCPSAAASAAAAPSARRSS